MNKKILFALTLAVLAIFSGSRAVLAQATPLQEGRETIKNKITEVKEKAKEKAQGVRKKLEDKRAERVTNFNRRMMARFDASIVRLEDIARRIDSHLAKLAKDGKDV